MNPMAILKEVEADVKSFGSISSDIRETLKSGVADLTAIRAEMRSLVEAVKSKATGALSSLKALADEVSKDASTDEDGKLDPAPQPEPKAPAPVVDLSAGTTVHTAADGFVTTLDHDAATITAKDDEGTPVVPHPDDVKAVVQATVDAGVAVPEAVAADAGVTVAAPEAAPVI